MQVEKLVKRRAFEAKQEGENKQVSKEPGAI